MDCSGKNAENHSKYVCRACPESSFIPDVRLLDNILRTSALILISMMGLSLLSSAILDELSDVFQMISSKFGWFVIGRWGSSIHQTALKVILTILFAIVIFNIVQQIPSSV